MHKVLFIVHDLYIVVSKVFACALNVYKEYFIEKIRIDFDIAKYVVPLLTWNSFKKCKTFVMDALPNKKKSHVRKLLNFMTTSLAIPRICLSFVTHVLHVVNIDIQPSFELVICSS
jgi:hypothetical protein